MRFVIAWSLVMLSALLFALSIVGEVIPRTTKARSEPYRAPRHYYESLLPRAEFLSSIAKLSELSSTPEHKARALFELVRDSYVHDPESGYLMKPWDNWILWLMGQFDSRRLQSQDAHFLLSRGIGFCDQAAMIFTGYAQEMRMESRLVWLSGHVVSEILLPQGWRVVDPDLGIFWNLPLEDFGTNYSATDIRQVIVAQGFGLDLAEIITEAYVTQSNSRRSSYPYLPRLYRDERAAQWAKWILPGFILAGGIMLGRKVPYRVWPGFGDQDSR